MKQIKADIVAEILKPHLMDGRFFAVKNTKEDFADIVNVHFEIFTLGSIIKLIQETITKRQQGM